MSTPARSVQFRNPGDVLTAFESRNVADFSIWQGKQFMFKYEGGDIGEGSTTLQDLLNVLGQSAAIYTLRVYEDLNGAKIKSNTPDDGSFNFRLLDETAGMQHYNNNNGLQSEVNALKLKIAELEEERDEEPGGDSLGALGEILQHPVVQQFMPEIIAYIKGSPPVPAKIAGVPTDPNQKIQEALFILNGADVNFSDHLYKLATIARTNPAQFKMLLGMLDNF